MIIIGAGLAGLIAASIFPDAELYEAQSSDNISHKALLRFRSPDVGNALGIEFKPVEVRKAIWHHGAYHEPNIRLANLYSKKVIGRLANRSIWNTSTVTRYIAPEDLIPRLVERYGARIHWNVELGRSDIQGHQETIISTAPMGVLASILDVPEAPQFAYSQIRVHRFRLPRSDVYQTIYFPDPNTSLYRASITGDLLTLEFIGNGDYDRDDLVDAFGIDELTAIPTDTTTQRFGKIAPIDDAWRRKFIFQSTLDHNIYSLGRFATWRNILLDDVLHDAHVIKKLSKGDVYTLSRSR